MRYVHAIEIYLRWLLRDAYALSVPGLALYRIAYALFIFTYHTPTFVWISGNPDTFYFPPPQSLPGWFAHGFPPDVVLWGLTIGVYVSLLGILLGVYTRFVSVAFSVVVVVGLSFSFSFGKIDHNLIVWVIPFFMAATPWGEAYSIDAWRRGRTPDAETDTEAQKSSSTFWGIPAGVPVAIIGLLLAFCMWTAGAQKVLGGWLDPATHAAYGHVVQAVEVFNRTPPLSGWVRGLDHDALLESLDALVIVFEVGFLVAFFHPVLLRLFIVGALFFHLGVYLTMGIRTEILVIVYVLLLVNWDRLARWLRRVATFSG